MKKIIKLNIILLVIFLLLPNCKMIKLKGNNIEICGSPNVISFEENLKCSFEMDLTKPSHIKEETLKQMFANTKMEGLEKYFIQAEKDYGINAIYLAGLACHESNYNTSNFANTRNNLFGWQSYDNNLNATKRFESKGECILFVASRLQVKYLNNGKTTIQSISNNYASDKDHAKKVYKIMEKLLTKVI